MANTVTPSEDTVDKAGTRNQGSASRRPEWCYLGHKNLKGMFAVDAGSTQGVAQIMQKYNFASSGVHAGGYDLLPTTLQLIKGGHLDFTIDQQPYLQGFLTNAAVAAAMLCTFSGPGGVSWGRNRIDLFVRGTDNALWHKSWDGMRWSNWEGLGGTLTSAPSATSAAEGNLEVFALSTASSLYHRAYFRGWQPWKSEDHYWAGSWLLGPGTVSPRFYLLATVFEVGSNGRVWRTNIGAASQ